MQKYKDSLKVCFKNVNIITYAQKPTLNLHDHVYKETELVCAFLDFPSFVLREAKTGETACMEGSPEHWLFVDLIRNEVTCAGSNSFVDKTFLNSFDVIVLGLRFLSRL